MKKLYFIVTGIAALIMIAFPSVMVIGLIFIVPGLFLGAAPTLFIYSGMTVMFMRLVSKTTWRYLFLISLSTAVALGCLVAWSVNLPIEMKIDRIYADDITLPNDFRLQSYDTLAIFTDNNITRFSDLGTVLCDSLCQRLLYNDAVKTVLVGQSIFDWQKDSNAPLAAFSRQNATKCIRAGITAANSRDITLPEVSLRMASGDCLVKSTANLSQATLVFQQQHVLDGEPGIAAPWNLWLDTVEAQKIELLVQKEKKFKPIYRFTKITAEPFMYPFTVGPVFGSGIHVKSGFMRYEKSVNGNSIYADFLKDYRPQLIKIFGSTINQ